MVFLALSKHRGGAYALWQWTGDSYRSPASVSNFITSAYNEYIDEEEDNSDFEEGHCHYKYTSVVLSV